MSLPPLLHLEKVEDYRRYYISNYCCEKIFTFDSIRVRFRSEQFAHAFYESSAKNGWKDGFSWERAKRINWIKETLENPKADSYQGRDKRNNSYDNNRRISVVYENFVVIIDITKKGAVTEPLMTTFVTAYPADQYAMEKIRKAPRWKR